MAIVVAIILLLTLLSNSRSELSIVNGSTRLCDSDQVTLTCIISKFYAYWTLSTNNRGDYIDFYMFYNDRHIQGYTRSFGAVNSTTLYGNFSYTVSTLTLRASGYSGPLTIRCNDENIRLQINPLPPSDISLRTLYYSEENLMFFVTSLNFTDMSKYTIELSPHSNITIRNYSFIISLQTDAMYNLTLQECGNERTYEIGPCPLLSFSPSYRVLYYNLSSSGGVQTMSVLRCDWEREVVVMECTQNGDWKSINEQNGLCNADSTSQIINKLYSNSSHVSLFSDLNSTITTIYTMSSSDNKQFQYSVLYSNTALIIYGVSFFLIVVMCSCIYITGFFCGVKSITQKNINQEKSSNTRVEAIYEDLELREVNTGMVINPNIAYEDVKLQ